MDVSGEFVLARDVALVAGLVSGGGRLGDRGDTCEVAFIEDTHTLHLISRFRTPTTICDAIWETAAEVRRHPEDILDRCYPALRRLIADGYIVAACSALARRSGPHVAVGSVG